MIKDVRALVPAAGMVLAVLLGGCSSAAGTEPGNNTDQVCAAKGQAARGVVVDMFAELARADEAVVAGIYEKALDGVGAHVRDAAAEASEPTFVKVLNEIATDVDKASASPDGVGMPQFTIMLKKLERFCPHPGSGSIPQADGAVGAAGSKCVLPLTFRGADDWGTHAIPAESEHPLLNEMARRGAFRLACEVNAKPVGYHGFIKVWLDESGAKDTKLALQHFLAEGRNREVTYDQRGAGVEVSFERFYDAFGQWWPRRVYTISTERGIVALELGGRDVATHQAMHAAYELAVTTATP